MTKDIYGQLLVIFPIQNTTKYGFKKPCVTLDLILQNVQKVQKSRSSRPKVFCKIGASCLISFSEFTGQHLCQSKTQVFSCELEKFLRTPIL